MRLSALPTHLKLNLYKRALGTKLGTSFRAALSVQGGVGGFHSACYRRDRPAVEVSENHGRIAVAHDGHAAVINRRPGSAAGGRTVDVGACDARTGRLRPGQL